MISINRIDYGYRYVADPYDVLAWALGTSGPCQVDVNCSEGDNWRDESRAVANFSVAPEEGSGWCSCALINNTANDSTPYVLTASHCLEPRTSTNKYTVDGCIFYWHYERSGCSNNTYMPLLRSSTGATIVASSSSTDFALLKIHSSQDPRYITGVYPYYLGWDRSGNPGTGGVCIHHPKTDVKKIATYSKTPVNSTCSNSDFWDIGFIQTANGYSVMQEGSSGAPLINSDRKVIGQLKGNGSCKSYECDNPAAQKVAYGKFNISWTGNGASDYRYRLNHWLDPIGSNPSTLSGMGVPVPVISGPSLLCVGTNYQFSIANIPAGFTWNKSSNITSVLTSGNVAIYTGNACGTGWISISYSGIEVFRKNVWVGQLGARSQQRRRLPFVAIQQYHKCLLWHGLLLSPLPRYKYVRHWGKFYSDQCRIFF